LIFYPFLNIDIHKDNNLTIINIIYCKLKCLPEPNVKLSIVNSYTVICCSENYMKKNTPKITSPGKHALCSTAFCFFSPIDKFGHPTFQVLKKWLAFLELHLYFVQNKLNKHIKWHLKWSLCFNWICYK